MSLGLFLADDEQGGAYGFVDLRDHWQWKNRRITQRRRNRHVFLDVPIELCYERIMERGREMEKDITIGYLAHLRDSYLFTMDRNSNNSEIISLTGEETPQQVAEHLIERYKVF